MEAIAMFLWHLLVALVCGWIICCILFSLVKKLACNEQPAKKDNHVEDDDSKLVIAKRDTADGKGWNIVAYLAKPGTES